MDKYSKGLPWYIKIFISLYPILPTYLAINISDRLPLITASRVLLILLAFFSIVRGISVKRFIAANRRGKAQRYRIALWAYVLTQFVISFVHFNGQSINNMLSIILECLVLFYFLPGWLNSEERIIEALKIVVLTSSVVCFFAILEPFLGVNFAYVLDTAHRSTILKAAYMRNGILRAEFTFGHPITLAMYLLLVFPVSMYFASNTRRRRYFIIAMMNIATIVLTSSRFPIFVAGCIFIIGLFTGDKLLRRAFAKVVLYGGIALGLLVAVSPGVMNAFLKIIQNVLGVVGIGVGATSENLSATSVRLAQWSVLKSVFQIDPIFGAGLGYISRNSVYYTNSNGNLGIMRSIDCEYLEQLIEGGLVGFSGFMILATHTIKTTCTAKYRKLSSVIPVLALSFLGTYIGYITVSELNSKAFWLFFTFLYAAIIIDNDVINAWEVRK